MVNKLNTLLLEIFKQINIYFFTIDNIFSKIVIFSQDYIIEISLLDRWWYIKKSKYFYFYIRKFNDVNRIYSFINDIKKTPDFKIIGSVIKLIIRYEEAINNLFLKQNKIFFSSNFNKISSSKKILFILKWGWMEETIEKSFISYCSYSNIKLTVLYKFWLGYWGQQLNQDGFFNELKANNNNVNFLYNENFDDEFIDWLIDKETEVFSFQYDYKWKHKDLNMIVLSSVTDDEIDCSRYKNIFSCYNSKPIGYSTDKFINTKNTNIYKIFNPQNIDLLDNYIILEKTDNFLLSWWMSWCRDFSILNSLNWEYKWVIVSDETHEVKNFISMYRWIQSHYGFLGAFKLSQIWIFCHLEKFNDDDRSKMIATSICAGKPVIVPYNDWLIVKDILDNKLWLSYINWDWDDLLKKIRFFTENEDNIKQYSENCLTYSRKNMDINKFMNIIFENSFN